jgi:hypothetical protein
MRVTPRVSAWCRGRATNANATPRSKLGLLPVRAAVPAVLAPTLPTHGGTCSLRQRKTRRKNDAEMTTPRGTNDPTSGRRPKYPQAVAVSGFSLPRESSESRRCVPTELSYRFEQWSPVSFTPRFVAVYDDAHEWRDFVASAAVGDVFLAGPVGRHCERSGVCSDGRSDLTQEDRKMA